MEIKTKTNRKMKARKTKKLSKFLKKRLKK